MDWNWQQGDWPDFRWDAACLRKAEEQFLRGAGVFVGSVGHLGAEERERLIVESMSTEAATTSEIEGEILDRASVQSSLRRQLGLAVEPRRAKPAEQGIAEMMADLYVTYQEPLTEQALLGWHRQLMKGRDIAAGQYRSGEEPMQVVSGAMHAPRVHFEAPPSERVPGEMSRFVEWFNASSPGGGRALPALTRAGIAHLYFESIHPFEDGNGRMGRAISEKALAQGAGEPTLTALAATILIRRKAYYAALEAANKSNEITAWLRWFAGIGLEAQRRTQARVEFLIDSTKLMDRLKGSMNERQERAVLRMLREGPDGFKGGLSAGNYASITGASTATTTRDLADLVEKGGLVRRGERRHARYFLSIALRPVGEVRVGEEGDLAKTS